MSAAAPSPAPLLRVAHIGKRFGGVTALRDVSLDVRAGECHALMGENGAGKSTLMKILSGVIPDYDGSFEIDGRRAAFTGTRDAEAAGVGIIHQELNLVDDLSVVANLFLGRELRSRAGWLDERVMHAAAAAVLRELDCAIDPHALVGTLRVGDQQLVEIAKALLGQARLLILDEPTSALTEAETARLFRVLAGLRSRGVTLIYISHKLDEVFRLADRITVLRDGAVVETLDRASTTPRDVTRLMVGRDLGDLRVGDGRSPGEVLLDVRGLSVPWPGHARGWRLRDVSFELRRGEVVGVAGLMGAGRTELLEALFGCSAEPPLGEIRWQGRPVHFRHPAEAQAAGLALVTEDRKRLGLFPQGTVRDNVTICTLPRYTRGGVLAPAAEREAAGAAVAAYGVKTDGLEAPILSLSGGNQQKAIIARWLLDRPQALLLDDPTRGVDVGAKAELYRLIDRLCRDGLAVLVTSSELPELITLCDRILVLCEGRLTAEFPRAEFSEARLMEAATRVDGPGGRS